MKTKSYLIILIALLIFNNKVHSQQLTFPQPELPFYDNVIKVVPTNFSVTTRMFLYKIRNVDFKNGGVII